jgi:hypothetical protein
MIMRMMKLTMMWQVLMHGGVCFGMGKMGYTVLMWMDRGPNQDSMRKEPTLLPPKMRIWSVSDHGTPFSCISMMGLMEGPPPFISPFLDPAVD